MSKNPSIMVSLEVGAALAALWFVPFPAVFSLISPGRKKVTEITPMRELVVAENRKYRRVLTATLLFFRRSSVETPGERKDTGLCQSYRIQATGLCPTQQLVQLNKKNLHWNPTHSRAQRFNILRRCTVRLELKLGRYLLQQNSNPPAPGLRLSLLVWFPSVSSVALVTAPLSLFTSKHLLKLPHESRVSNSESRFRTHIYPHDVIELTLYRSHSSVNVNTYPQ